MVEILRENGKNKNPNLLICASRSCSRTEPGHVKVKWPGLRVHTLFVLESRVKQLDWFCNSFYSTVESLPLSKIFCSDAKYLIESLASRNGCVLCADHENIGSELGKYNVVVGSQSRSLPGVLAFYDSH